MLGAFLRCWSTAALASSVRQLLFAGLVLSLYGCVGWVAEEAERQHGAGHSEQAMRILEEGMRNHPQSAELRSAWLRIRDTAVQNQLTQAQNALQAGKLDDAERALQRALTLEPEQTRAQQELSALRQERRALGLLADARKLAERGQPVAALKLVAEGLKSSAQHEGLLSLQRELWGQQRERQARQWAGLAEQRPITLDFKDAGLRQVLDLVTRHSGLNFVLDKDIRQDLRVTLFLKNVRVDDALDLIVTTHQLARKVLDDRTVMIYPNTADKQKEYQEQVIRVFYLANGEAKSAAAFLKTMARVKEPFVDERSNMLAVRESPETVALVERLVGLFDTQEPEVMLELEVLEVRSTRLTELGVKFPSSATLTPLGEAGAAGLTVANLRSLNEGRIGVSVGGLTLNLRREVGDFEILANPRVRARNKEKAKVLIGDKVPIVTTTTSQTGFVADSVSYLDVGLKLEVEPTVYSNDEVAIKLGLEVGSLAGQIKTTSGTVAYQVSTRNASTALRLRDGETQVLAGLLRREERTSASRLPVAGDVPLLGRLFSSTLDDGNKTELVLAITPRIVRNLRQPDASEAEIWVGTDSHPRLRTVGGRAPTEDGSGTQRVEVPIQPAGALSQGRSPQQGLDLLNKPQGASAIPSGQAPKTIQAGGEDLEAAQVLQSALAVQSAQSPGGVAAPLSSSVSLRWQIAGAPKVGQPMVISLIGQTTAPLRGLSLLVQVPPNRLQLQAVDLPDWWAQGGIPAVKTHAVDETNGQWQLGVLRNGANGATGDGEWLRLRIVPQQAGMFELNLRSAQVLAAQSGASASAGQPRVAIPPPLVLQIQP